MKPAPVPTAQPASWEVFVSSTIDDLKSDRRAVQKILRKAEVEVRLSEEWSGGWDDTVQKCRDRIMASQAFFLILGFWYGSIPPGSEKSITQMEFEWAVSKWGGSPTPPLSVMTPAVGSRAEKILQKKAKFLVDNLKEPDRSLHATRLETFHLQAKAPIEKWRTVRTFTDQNDLAGWALASIKIWTGRTFDAAANGTVTVADPVAVPSQISEQQLGLLGRTQQIEAAKSILAKLASLADEPAICLVVSGDEDAEHELFLKNLMQISAFRKARPSRLGRPPQGQYDIGVLTSWVAGRLGVANTAAMTGPRELAEAVASELKKQALCFVLDQVHRLTGGVNSFQLQFWEPLQQRLRELRAEQHFNSPLIAVVVEYTGEASGWSGAVTPAGQASAGSFGKPILLPVLSSVTSGDVFRWCDEVNAPDDDDFRRQLADRILHDPKGKPDGAASRVYLRIRSETVWPEEGTK
jgi:hypothetical protein